MTINLSGNLSENNLAAQTPPCQNIHGGGSLIFDEAQSIEAVVTASHCVTNGLRLSAF